jgi:hypothetical protein
LITATRSWRWAKPAKPIRPAAIAFGSDAEIKGDGSNGSGVLGIMLPWQGGGLGQIKDGFAAAVMMPLQLAMLHVQMITRGGGNSALGLRYR